VSTTERDPIEYLINAMERAGQDTLPAAHGYGDKRRAVLAAIVALRAEADDAKAACYEWDAMHARAIARAEQAESALTAAQAEIRRMRTALKDVLPVTCNDVHHAKRDQHDDNEACPILGRAVAALGLGEG